MSGTLAGWLARACVLAAPLALGSCQSTTNYLFGVGDCKLERLGQTPVQTQNNLVLVVVQVNGHAVAAGNRYRFGTYFAECRHRIAHRAEIRFRPRHAKLGRWRPDRAFRLEGG